MNDGRRRLRRSTAADAPVDPEFDEAAYLDANPDVAAAVARGTVPSGRAHWDASGRSEGRALTVAGSRNAIVRAELDAAGRGIELGPLDRPIMAKRDGFRVEIVDYMDTDAIRAHYSDPARGVDVSMIEEVDHVSAGGPLVELIGEEAAFDWVVASHVIEHVPDLVSFLLDVERLLTPTGRLGLVVPDKRYCFDHYGELTTTGQVVDAYVERRTRPTPGQVIDYYARTAGVDGSIAWGQRSDVLPAPLYGIGHMVDGYRRSLDGDTFGGEIHCWRFTPESFRLLVGELRAMGLIGLGVVAEHDTVGVEFFATLGRVEDPDPVVDRLAQLRAVRDSDR